MHTCARLTELLGRRTRDPTRPLEESLARYDPQGTEPSVKLVYPETDTIL